MCNMHKGNNGMFPQHCLCAVKGTGNKACFLGPHGDFAKGREQGLFLQCVCPSNQMRVFGQSPSFLKSLVYICKTNLTQSIFTGAQYVTLDNKIKCLSLAFFSGNPTNKTVTGTPYTWGLLIANHLGSIIVIDQSEILSRSQVQFITLFFGGPQLCCALYQPWQAARIWCKKTNFLS